MFSFDNIFITCCLSKNYCQIVQLSKIDVDQILKEDVNISSPENASIKRELIRQIKLKPNWSNIS